MNTMFSGLKKWFISILQKLKPYLGYVAAFIGGILAFLLLGKKRSKSSIYEDKKKQQEERIKEAEKTEQSVKDSLEKANEIIEKYEEKKRARR